MEDSLGSSDSEKELKHELLDVGIKLLSPPSSIHELLTLLDKVEHILTQVGQDPSKSMQDALVPSMKALISNELLMHPLVDVRISVVSCISEILRITAPHQPFIDEKMKEIFELTLIAFKKLSELSGHCYSKALQILETVAKVRSCVMLLDLGCDALIVQIFQLFFNTIRLNHPHSVFSNMEEVMIWLIEESDDVSVELLKPILASVKKQNQALSPLSWKLGEEVLRRCSAKVKPYLSKEVKLMRVDLDDYSEIVTSLCQDEPSGGNLVIEDVKPDTVRLNEVGLPANNLSKPLQDDLTTQERTENAIVLKNQNSLETLHSVCQLEHLNDSNEKSSLKPEPLADGEDSEAKADEGAIPRRRGRKPNSLMKPEEGYDHSWTGRGKNSLETPHGGKNHEIVVSLAKNSPPRTLHVDSTNSPNTEEHSGSDTSRRRKRGRPKRESTIKVLLPRGQVKENREQNLGVDLTTGSGNKEDAAVKTRRGSRRRKCSTASDREGLRMIVPKKEDDILSDTEVNPHPLLRHTDGTKQMNEKASSQKQNTKELDEKIMPSPVGKVLSQDENLAVSVVKSKRRRKTALQEEEGFKRPTFVKDYGEELVGSRIKVWWPLDQMFYEGVINSFCPSTMKHRVLYTDGDLEILNLNKERWVLLDDVPMNEDEEADVPVSAAMPAKSEGTKASRTTKSKAKQDNSGSSSKRSRSAPRRGSSKSAESSTVDTLRAKDNDSEE